jgi:uncharacterized protein (DUF1501 family)
MTIHRRNFLRGAAAGLGAMLATSGLRRWAATANAASIAGYAGHRSLVAVHLLGGNDGNQMLVPTDAPRFGLYQSARPGIALALADLRKISPTGLPANSFGLHPALAHLQVAFTAGHAALVANVGPVALPTTKTTFALSSHAKPTNLFSHSDQQDAWSSAVPVPAAVAAAVARAGWGGRLSAKVAAVNPALPGGAEYPGVTLLGGRRLFVDGPTPPLVTSSTGELTFPALPNADLEALRSSALKGIVGITGTSELEHSYGGEFGSASAIAAERNRARDAAWTALPNHAAIEALLVGAAANWTLPGQILAVLKDIVAGGSPRPSGLGLKRQVYSVGFGSFDTHAGQRAAQDDLLAQLDFSLNVFSKGMDMITAAWPHAVLPPQSTLFSMSDFGRTLSENSDGGTDHGWGNHMFVLGSRVAGGVLHGRFPDLTAASTDSTDTRGRWIPTLSVDQYVYDLALWLGVSLAEAAEIFPNHADYLAFANANSMDLIYRRVRLPLTLAG